MLIVTGATAVGKTDLVYQLTRHLPIEIINADMGQLYVPLTIGTAKPMWQDSPIVHHLFDIINEPISWSVVQYREEVSRIIDQVRQRGALPVVVGGSGFYISSLLFSLSAPGADVVLPPEISISWEFLAAIDPVRAQAIHYNDTYRIKRALQVWYATQQLPSQYEPLYDPITPSWALITVDRDRQELYNRINERVPIMFNQGWIAEVEALLDTPWEEFLLQKKIIGYDDIIRALRNEQLVESDLIALIAQKTRAYAKRQGTLLRSIQQRLSHVGFAHLLQSVTLTGDDWERYINPVVKHAMQSEII